jgi:hypothetical protein
MLNDPSVVNSRIGEYAPDGGLLRDATLCFVTGKRVVPGDVTLRLGGTLFIRIRADVFQRITPEERQAIEAEALVEAERSKVQAAPTVSVPDYDAMSGSELSALAAERGVDLEGTRNKQQVVSRLRVADVQARFAIPPVSEGSADTEERKD